MDATDILMFGLVCFVFGISTGIWLTRRNIRRIIEHEPDWMDL